MIILILIFLVVVPVTTLSVIYVWVGKKQRELRPEEFLAWCKRSYLGMDEPFVVSAPEKKRTAQAKRAIKETRGAQLRQSMDLGR